jgi:hypothetical protein
MRIQSSLQEFAFHSRTSNQAHIQGEGFGSCPLALFSNSILRNCSEYKIEVIPVTGRGRQKCFEFCSVELLEHHHHHYYYYYFKNSVAWVREWTIPTEQPPLVGEVNANFCVCKQYFPRLLVVGSKLISLSGGRRQDVFGCECWEWI